MKAKYKNYDIKKTKRGYVVYFRTGALTFRSLEHATDAIDAL